MLSQSLECLGRLVCKKLLFSSCLSQVSQVPRSVRRNRLDSSHELSQRPHEFFLSAIPLSNQVRSESSVIACHSKVSQLVTATAGTTNIVTEEISGNSKIIPVSCEVEDGIILLGRSGRAADRGFR